MQVESWIPSSSCILKLIRAAGGGLGNGNKKLKLARVSAAVLSPLGNPSSASHLFSLPVSIKTLTPESSFPFVSSVFGRRNMASSVLSDCSLPAPARLLPFQRSVQSRTSQFQRSVSFAWRPLSLSAIRSTASPHWSLSASASVAVTTETSAKVIDGKAVAKQIKDEIAGEIVRMKDGIGIVPGLAVILVGSRKDSQTYVRNKKKACEAVGIKSYEANLPEDSTEEEVLKHIACFNDDPSVHGILVQLPLPRHMNEEKILNAIGLEKDVDGFHPLNIGRLSMQGRDPLFVPCTPKGCMELLHRYGVEIKGKRAVVIGRSNIVGMPAALLLQKANATISMVHSYTKNPVEITRQADIIISAAGVANLVRGSWIKPGAVVIDVGINPVDDAQSPRGYRLVGDVCYEEACKVASAITPVPGGVGPMTIAMLLSNTLSSAKRIHDFKWNSGGNGLHNWRSPRSRRLDLILDSLYRH